MRENKNKILYASKVTRHNNQKKIQKRNRNFKQLIATTDFSRKPRG